MKGTVKYAVASLLPSYSSVGMGTWNKFTSFYEKPQQVLAPKGYEKTNGVRSIWRRLHSKPTKVLVLGWTTIYSGHLHYIDEFGTEFMSDGHMKAWKVIPYSENDNRYYKPFLCHEDDLYELYTEASSVLTRGQVWQLREKFPEQNKEVT